MSLPKTVRVGSIEYKVVTGSRRDLDLGKRYLGFIDSENATIYICDEVDPQEQFTTLWHEIFHAMIYETNDKIDEDPIERLSRMLVCILRDNQGLSRAEPWTANSGRRRSRKVKPRSSAGTKRGRKKS